MNDHDADDSSLVGQLFVQIKAMVGVGQAQVMATQGLGKKIDRLATMQPVNFRAIGSVLVDAGGFGVIQFSPGGPDQGHVWEIQNIVVGGDTFATAAAGTPEFYASGADLRTLKDASPPITDLVDATAISLPTVAFYSRGQYVLRNSEALYVRIVGGTSGQQYAAVARGIDYQESAKQQVAAL